MKNILYDTDYFEMDLGFAYHFVNNQSILGSAHTHNFYEYIFITAGEITLIVNERIDMLKAGNLVFIRPDDVHEYRIDKHIDFEMIHVSFTGSQFDSLCHYLGNDVKKKLTTPYYPPVVNISGDQERLLIKEHEFLNFFSGDKNQLTTRLKFLLTEVAGIFIKHPMDREREDIHEWLEVVLEQMNTQENIEEGIPALLRITNFSHGHLCRIMKTHMGTTPTKYVTDLRLIYASNLLVNSDMDILTIAIKVGYTSLSHFIMTFKSKYGMPPSKYRKLHAKKWMTTEMAEK